MSRGCCGVLLTEEVLAKESLAALIKLLARQPAWSDIPVTLLTSTKGPRPRNRHRLAALARAANLSLLARPFQPSALRRVLQANLRARKRQCETRKLIESIESNPAAEISYQLAAIVESSDDAIIGKDLNGVITSWNRAAEELFGYRAKEIIGQPVSVLMPAEQRKEEPTILDRIRRGERIQHYETVRRRKSGSLVEISLTVSPIKDARGRIIGASKIVRDITERKQAERKLEQANHELVTASRA